jgi:hypothetical protein
MRRTSVRIPKISKHHVVRSRETSNVYPIQQESAAHTIAHKISEEKHYTPSELASMWHFSPATIRKIVRNEAGVLKLQGMGSSYGKRSYTTFSIPESVAFRIHERLTQESFETKIPRRKQRRVVFVRDRNRRVA